MKNNILHIDISGLELAEEIKYFKETKGTLRTQPNKNKIVLYYQQDNFYKNEKI